MKEFIAEIVTRWHLERAEWLLFAPTSEGKAAREQGLRDVEAMLLAREDWSSPQERARDAQIQPKQNWLQRLFSNKRRSAQLESAFSPASSSPEDVIAHMTPEEREKQIEEMMDFVRKIQRAREPLEEASIPFPPDFSGHRTQEEVRKDAEQ